MLKLLDENYKQGLSDEKEHALTEISVVGNSFAAFQLRIVSSSDALLLTGDCHEELSDRKLPVWRLRLSAEGYDFQVFQVGLINGVADPLLRKRCCILEEGKPLILFCVAQTGAAPVDSMVSILLKQEGIGETRIQQAQIPIKALEYDLPSPRAYVKKIDLWQHNTCIARYYDVEEYSNAHFSLMKGYLEALAWLGQKSVSIIAAHTPWDGQRRGGADQGFPADLFESQMPRIQKTDSGLVFDFSVIDRYIALCESLGIDGEYEVFGLCGAWTSRTVLRAWAGDGFVDLQENEVEQYIAALYAHFEQAGYLDKTVICADEPQDPVLFRKELDRIRRFAPGFRFKAALDHPEFADEFAGELSVIVPSFFTACWRLDKLRAMNLQKTWYICCGPNKPNTFINSHLAETRALAYLNEIFGFDGILRWAFTAWPRAPYQEARVGRWEPGDTYLVYPGKDGLPVLSLRYYQLRRMMEDLQLLSMLPMPDSHIRRIWHNDKPETFEMKEWTVTGDLFALAYAEYEAVRRDMIEEIKCIH